MSLTLLRCWEQTGEVQGQGARSRVGRQVLVVHDGRLGCHMSQGGSYADSLEVALVSLG